MEYKLSLDIGGTSIKIGLFKGDKLVQKEETPTEAKRIGGPGIRDKVIGIVERYKDKFPIIAVGISTAGIVNHLNGEVVFAGPNIPNYAGINLKEAVEITFGIKCEVGNDVNCALLGEVNYGGHKNIKNCLMITIGTGIGASLMIEGNIYHGHSLSAGEIGYIKVKGQKFEDIGSTASLVRDCKKRLDVSDLDGYKIIELYHQGNEIVKDAIETFSENIALGIVTSVYLLNPQTVLLGGGIMKNKNLFGPIIREHMSKHLIPTLDENTSLSFATLDNDAGLYGALSLI